MTPTIAVDVNIEVGVDLALQEILQFFKEGYHADVLVVGDQTRIKSSEHHQGLEGRIKVVHAPETITLPTDEEDQGQYLRKLYQRFKKQFRESPDSLSQGLALLVDQQAQVLVSNGNSGAVGMLARATRLHRRIKAPPACIYFPTHSSQIPKQKKDVAICDVGTFLNPSKEDLAVNYLLLRQELIAQGVSEPAIALLNIGEEKSKGGFYQKVYDFFRTINLPGFYGNGEANQVFFNQEIDGYVCGAFPGNIGLKTAESMHRFDIASLKDACLEMTKQGLNQKLIRPLIQRFVDKTDFQGRKWAKVLGSDKKIILGHGNAGPLSLLQTALQYAQAPDQVQPAHAAIEEYQSRVFGQ